MNKIERLLSILVFLLNKDVISADELSKKFEVSKRTIYRDIDSLAMSGLPIVSIHGRNGGVGLIPSYKMDKYLFSDEEKQKIIDALQIQHNILPEDNQILIDKLENLKGDEEYSPNFTFYSPTIHRNEIEIEIIEKLKTFKEAISLKRKVKIKYVSLYGELTNRVISPYSLLLKDGSWYVEAFCEKRNNRRVFKLTRIRESLLLEEDCISIHRKEIDLAPQLEQVALSFQRNQLGKLYDFFVEEEIEVLNDAIKVSFTYDSSKNLVPFLLMFGSAVDVLEPKSLKDSYDAELNNILKK